ncbi:BTAD domain-containing putative transcriptional regulator [Mycolicibacterium sp. 141076]|uniref:BTAD domain-containing putative transcriptional regulator n=1 Tax=Mycobacteriaceae TaxID=1762 RepID=UPI00299EAEE2|nr:BTAD domain-containing putative transcriptional regulator [Mycolicibacterium sp. 141076]MDX1878278.1 BTAD domain-containing putative transcriptional regulator [Mycolicibacterium sp. 141076]
MAVEFRVLGDVEVLVDDRRLDVGHARQRCVLVALLVDVNRPVSSDQLIDRVWADEPPHKARNALAAYISRLRQLFSETDGVQIVRGPAGYALQADPRTVDVHLFRDTLGRARTAPNPAEAAGLFDTALRLWRGEPFATIDTPWANEVRGSLEAERFSAVLDRNDAALGAGRHGEFLNELTTTLQAHPLDERVAGQLMLAQYRCGRQAAALKTYRAMRERLVEELGVDPSPALQAVQQQILDGDPARPVQHHAAAAPAAAEPVVPRRVTRLVGRDDDVRRVISAFDDGPVVTLTGVGGVGKTRLALETAAREERNFVDGVWVCELAPLSDGSAIGRAVAAALRVQAGYGQDVDDAVIDHLRPLKLLLVIDNCEHVLTAAATLIDRITYECPGVTVLATSREPLGVEAERIVPVQPLSEDDAAELFVDRARASRPDFDPDREPAGAVAEICRRLDGVPLAIELAAARMRAMSSGDVARRLDRLRLLSGGKRGAHPRQQSVTATIDWSFRLLSGAEQQLFARLSVFAGGFDLDAVHGVCADPGTTDDDVLDMLMGLVDKSMVMVRTGPGGTRYDVLETLRAYGRERLQDNGSADAVASRHATYFVELAERASAGMRGRDEAAWVQRVLPKAGTTFVAPDFDNLRTAFEFAMSRHDIDLALRLATSLPEIHLRVGYDPMDWVERAIQAADRHHPLFPAAVGTVARGYQVLGEFAHARAIIALAEGREPGADVSFLAYPADVLADVAMNDGDLSTSTAYFEELFSGAGDGTDPLRRLLAAERISLGYQAMRTNESALPAAREAVRIADGVGNPTGRALARCALARALSVSQPDEALLIISDAHELASTVENTWLIAMAEMESATIHAARGDRRAAARGYHVTLEMFVIAGPSKVIPLQWDNLGCIARFMFQVGALPEAAALHHAAVAAGRRPPLSADQVAQLDGVDVAVPRGTEIVDYARTALRRFI